MKILIDLTEEEIRMIRFGLEDRGDNLFSKKGDAEEQNKYYELAEKFRLNGKETEVYVIV